MGIKSTVEITKSEALQMIEQEVLRKTENASCKDIEEFLELVLDIYNEDSRYYFNNFRVIRDESI